MALDSTAKISDIIAALKDMQGINQKEDLRSALTTKGVDVSDTDNIAELINKLNSANLVLDGKRWASGTQLNFIEGDSYNAICKVINLTFTPSIVFLRTTDLLAYVEGYNYVNVPFIAFNNYLSPSTLYGWSSSFSHELTILDNGFQWNLRNLKTNNVGKGKIEWYAFK